MTLKFLFDRLVAFIGLLFLWPILIIVAIMVKVKMPGGPAEGPAERVFPGRGLPDADDGILHPGKPQRGPADLSGAGTQAHSGNRRDPAFHHPPDLRIH